jgi:hypothetical protein
MAFSIRYDEGKQRLYLVLSGLMSDDDAREAGEQTIEMVKKLPQGFSIVTDISEFRPLSQVGVAHVRRAAEFCAKCGMKATARVVGISPTALQQFQRIAKEGNYTAYTARTVAEAEALLDAHKD